jgi:MFS family permease
MGMGQVAGGSAAFALGGALIAKFGATPAGWQATMLWLSSPLLVVAMLVWSMREPARTGVANRNSSVREACGALWRYRGSIAPLLAGTTMVAVADGAVLIWAAPTLARNFALSPERVGATMATALLIMGVLGPVAGGMLADSSQRRGGPRRTMRNLSLLACLSVPAAMFAMLSGATLASGLLCVFLTIGSAVGMGVTTVLTIVIPNELRGLTLTVVSATGALFGLGCAPVLVSALSGLLGGPASLGAALSVVCGAMSAAGAAALAYGSRRSPLQEGAG